MFRARSWAAETQEPVPEDRALLGHRYRVAAPAPSSAQELTTSPSADLSIVRSAGGLTPRSTHAVRVSNADR